MPGAGEALANWTVFVRFLSLHLLAKGYNNGLGRKPHQWDELLVCPRRRQPQHPCAMLAGTDP